MAKATRIDLARAGKEELLDFIDKSGTTIDPELPLPQLREKAMEIQQALVSTKDSDDLDKRAKAASAKILNEGEDDEDSEDGETGIVAQMRGVTKSKKNDINSLEVQPHDGESASINEIIEDSRRIKGDDMEETIEEKVLREHKKKNDTYKIAKMVAAADAEINEYHRDAMQRHKASRTNLCFYLLKGTNLSTLTTPYTKIQGVRLRKETPYRALDLEIKFFRTKRGMFGECEYLGDDRVEVSKAAKAKKSK